MAPRGGSRHNGQGLDLAAELLALAPELAAYFAAQVAFFALCLVVARQLRPRSEEAWELADLFFSAAVFPVMVWSALIAAWSLSDDVDLRWRGQVWESRFFMLLYTTRALLHCFVQCKMKMSKLQFLLMTLHHILTMLCSGVALVLQTMHFWGCFEGCCEVSTLFLNNMHIFKELTPGGKELRHVLPSWIYVANGVFLWLSFLVFRMVLFPLWLYLWYRDVSTKPEATWDRSAPIERYLYPAVTVFLLVISMYWFGRVTKGMMKTMGLLGKKDRKGIAKAE